MESTLKRERQSITNEMRRSWGLFNGEGHWNRNRPKWKVRATINYCFWVPTQWAATLGDSKPRVTFSAYNRNEQEDADIMQAAWVDVYHRRSWQGIIRDAILISRIEKKSFLRLTYDPYLNSGDGDCVLQAIPGSQIYINSGATCIDTAEVLLYEYEESYGALLQKYPKLRVKLQHYIQRTREDDNDQSLSTPAQSFVQPQSGTQQHMPPYTAKPSEPQQMAGTGGIPVKEFWTRPKGPKAKATVDSIVFTVGNIPASRMKILDFEDGHSEQMQIVVTEGNVVYELPYSQVELLKFAESYGGIRVLAVYDSVEVYTREKEVNMYPGGRRMVQVGDFIADDGMNPFSHNDWPFIAISAYNDPKRFWGMSDIDLIYDLNEYVNRLYSLFLDAALLTANPIWRLPLSSELSDEDITNAPGAVLREDQTSLKLGKREAGPELPQYLMSTLAFGIERIKEISGLSEIATGSAKYKGQQSAESIAMYQETASIRFRDAMADIDRAIVRLGIQFKGMVSQFYTSPRMVRIKNAAGVETPKTFFGVNIQTPMTVESRVGSMLPTSPTAKLQFMLSLLSQPKPIIDLHEVWALLAEVGLIESASAIEHRIEKELANPKQQWKVVGFPQPQKGQKKGQQPKKPGSARQNGPLSSG